ncbi:phosphopantetheine-binding protein [Phenylobacterium sp.]|uniref:phosphopantetheine-binding protein n=1 Tax=Phenylobacterium sp. TaxID=1871053 RepID=UPI003BACF388
MDALDVVRTALAEECGTDPGLILPQVHLLNDLDIDSLDLLNTAFRIEKDCGVKLPFRAWLTTEYGDEPAEVSPFLVAEICDFIARETRSALAASGGA